MSLLLERDNMQATGTPYPQPYMLEQPSNRMPVTNPAMPSAFNVYTGALTRLNSCDSKV